MMASEKKISCARLHTRTERSFWSLLSSVYCYFTFSYVNPLLSKGAKGNLNVLSATGLHPNVEHIEQTSSTFSRIHSELRNKYSSEKDSRKNLVMLAFVYQNWVLLLCHLLWGIAETSLRLCGPVFLRFYLKWLNEYSDDEAKYRDGWKWGFLTCLSPLLLTVVHQRCFWLGYFLGYKCKMSTMASLHSKLLKLNSSTIGKITTGHVVNLASNDAQRFEETFTLLPFILLGPLETAGVLIMMSLVLGFVPAISGLSCIFLLVSLQSIISRKIAKYRGKVARVRDKRINFINELISGNLAVKMLGWEEVLLKEVNSIRSKEHKLLTKVNYITSNMLALYGYIQTVMVCITFITVSILFFLLAVGVVKTCVLQYRYTGDEFSIADVFFAISLMSLPRFSMARCFTVSIQHLSELVVSTKRLDNFFRLPEPRSHDDLSEKSIAKGEVIIEHGNYGWYVAIEGQDTKGKNQTKGVVRSSPELVQTLKNIEFHVRPGELIGIVGKVGSGKSSLLTALLNEMERLDDRESASFSGSVAYCAQVPWIVEATVRENIIFGRQFDPDLYSQVVSSCALHVDFEQLPFGDETELGERGINLSGGQKARVALARAAYCKADINLLDDPLSAVDPRVGKILFEECIGGSEALMKNTTRLLITHQRHCLPFCNRIILLHDGAVQCVGTWEEVADHNLLNAIDDANNDESVTMNVLSERQTLLDGILNKNHTGASSADKQELQAETGEKSAEDTRRKVQLVKEEGKESGKVGWNVYWEYIAHIGILSSFSTFMLLVASRVLYFTAEWWVALWASTDESNQKKDEWVWVLVVLAAVVVCTVTAALFLIFRLMTYGSTNLHRQMARRVIYAPLRFFHTNPTGRILNRFSKDTGAQDDQLPLLAADFLLAFLLVIGTMILVIIALPYTIPVFLVIAFIFVKIRTHFVTTQREIKRYEAITRSPVYAMLSSNMKGLPTIRAFKKGTTFQNVFLEALESNGSWWLAFISTSRWAAFRMDAISALICIISVVTSTAMADYVSVEIIGLALTYVIGLSGSMQWCFRQSAELESKMTAVERTLEYTKLEQEPPKASEGGGEAPEDWPSTGKIDYSCVTASYRPELDPVLTDLVFTIPGGSSVGIVGRTGSGKSSLLLTLFRLIDLNEGQVFIDDIDTSKIGIDVLRKQLAIIPQDPVLFGGTIRSNLDPWNEYSDARLRRALTEVQLDDAVQRFGGLDSRILESGHNLSVGQRQLLCLARALLTNAKILALDEATANVDRTTDALIQKSLHSLITRSDKTLLIIAHRIDTVVDCDLLLVLDNGKKVEFGSPESLLKKPDGVFRSMVDAAKKHLRF